VTESWRDASLTARYLDELDAQSVTRQIDAAVDALGVDDSSTDAVGAGRRVTRSPTSPPWSR